MSNLVCGLMARRPIQKVAKLGQLGTKPKLRDLLFNYTSSSISMLWLEVKTLYLVHRLTTTNPCKIRSNGNMPRVT